MRADAEPLTPQQSRWLEQAKLGWTPVDTWCGECRYVLGEPGPGCCRYVPPRRSLWRRLLRKD